MKTKKIANKILRNDVGDLSAEEENEGKVGILFYILTFLAAIVIMIVVPLAVFYLAISYNVKGVRDTYKDDIKDIPILKYALGEIEKPTDPTKLTKEELEKYYTDFLDEIDLLEKSIKEKDKEIDELNKKIKELEKANEEIDTLKSKNKELEAEIKSVKEEYDKKKEELLKEKKEVDNLIATGDKEGFKEYFEKVDSENAEKIYESLKKEDVKDEEARNFALTYEEMDPEAVAGIFETLGNEKITLVTDILSYMEKDKTGEILAALDQQFAADITEKLANEYMYKVEE
jgi:flagellar motility protein MotE (MotC chaperone)